MEFIWAKGIREEKNITVAYTCRADLLGEGAILQIAAVNVYRLFVDGKIHGYGPARAAHGYVRSDLYDLGCFCGKADVAIVIEVFASNVNSYYLVDEPPFLGALLTVDGKRVCSTGPEGGFTAHRLTDRVQKVQRYSFQRPFTECYEMERCRSTFYTGDFSLFPSSDVEKVDGDVLLERNVAYPNLTSLLPYQAIEHGSARLDPSNEIWMNRAIQGIGEELKGFLYEDLDERLSDEASRLVFTNPRNVVLGSAISAGEYRLFDSERSLTGFFSLKVVAHEDSVFLLLWDEVVTETDKAGFHGKDLQFHRSECCNVIKYDIRTGKYDLLAFEPYTARYVKIVVLTGRIEIDHYDMILYENPDASRLRFSCDDSELESIIEAARNTFAQNSVDILIDCPSRERAGWLCDAYFSGRAERLFTGVNRSERNFLENYALAPLMKELPAGMVPMCYPADHLNGVYIPNWAMWYILELHDYYRRTRDTELIEVSRAKVLGVVEYFRRYLNEDGLLEDLEGWVFIEWSKANDPEFLRGVNYPSNMLYSAMLDGVAELYGRPDLSVQATGIRNRIREQSFHEGFFEDNMIRKAQRTRYTPHDASFQRMPDSGTNIGSLLRTGNTSETCQYYAFYFGIASPKSHPKLFETLIREFGPSRDASATYPTVHRSNAIVGNYLRLEILLRYGFGIQAIEECRAFFLEMVRTTGTLWEHSMQTGSLNHGFASIAANYLIECLAGYIRTDSLSKRICLREPDLLCDIDLEVPIGDETVRIQINDGRRIVTIPDGFRIDNECASKTTGPYRVS